MAKTKKNFADLKTTKDCNKSSLYLKMERNCQTCVYNIKKVTVTINIYMKHCCSNKDNYRLWQYIIYFKRNTLKNLANKK